MFVFLRVLYYFFVGAYYKRKEKNGLFYKPFFSFVIKKNYESSITVVYVRNSKVI